MTQEFLATSARDLLDRLVVFIPNFLGVVLFLLVGWLLARFVAWLVEKGANFLKIDSLLKSLKADRYLEKVGVRLNSGRFLGEIVYWIAILVVFLTAADMLNLFALSNFLEGVISYIPNLIVAALILIFAAIVADFARSAVKASAMAARLHSARLFGTIAWWAVMIFGIVTALKQLGVNTGLIDTAIMGIIMGGALAFGLAFGLGGKAYAEHLLEKVREQTEHRG
jgi:hypothetical protein